MSFINSEDAKKLTTDEGFKVLDVRDKSQFDRAHIKSCYHVPLFIENQDNDLGNAPSCLISYCLVVCSIYCDNLRLKLHMNLVFILPFNFVQEQLLRGPYIITFLVYSLGFHLPNQILNLCNLLRTSFHLRVNC